MQHLQCLWSETSCKLSSQAQLIPFMSLLKSVKLQSWTLLPPEYQQFLKSLRYNLWFTGLALEIYTVRNMAAQAYASTIQINEISSTLNNISSEIIKYNKGFNFLEFKGSNHLHGLISVYKYLKDVYFLEFNEGYQIFNISHENLPPLCKSIYISMNCKIFGPFPSNSTIDHINVKHLMIENHIIQSSDLLLLLDYYMNADKHTAISFLKCLKNYNKNNKNILINKFVSFLIEISDSDIFKAIMMNIDVILVNRRDFEDDIKIEVKHNYFLTILNKCTSFLEKDFIAMLPVLSWLCPNSIRLTLLSFICKYIDCDLYDSTDRYKCSKSLYYFIDLKDDIRVWNIVVELLQDEDMNVRVEVTRFVNRICFNYSSILNPYMCLRKMFEIETVCLIINSKLAFICFWNMLSKIVKRADLNETINPFFNEQSNVYQEQSNIMKLAFKGLKCLIYSKENLDYFKEVVEKCLNLLKTECEFKGTFIDEKLMILDTYSSIHFLNLYYKREILILLDFKDHLNMFSPIQELIYLSTKF